MDEFGFAEEKGEWKANELTAPHLKPTKFSQQKYTAPTTRHISPPADENNRLVHRETIISRASPFTIHNNTNASPQN